MRTPIVTLLAGAAVILAAGCRTPHEPTHFELAEKAKAQGDKTQALVEYQEAARLEPRHKYAWLNIGYLKAEKPGCKEYTRETRDALRTFLMLESYEIGDVAGDRAAGIPESPVEPHLARRVARGLHEVIIAIEGVEEQADVIYGEFLLEPGDPELKALAIEGQQAVLDANLGISPRAHYYLGEIARRSGDEAGAKAHYEQSAAQAKQLNRTYRNAQIGLALTGGDLEEGWLAIRMENRKDLYLDYAEAAIRRGQLDRAAFALEETRRHFVDVTVFRKLAEIHLLRDDLGSANAIIGVLERWPRRSKEVEIYLRLCAAALGGQKTGEWSSLMDKTTPGELVFDPARLAQHVGESKADGVAKAAVKKAAERISGAK